MKPEFHEDGLSGERGMQSRLPAGLAATPLHSVVAAVLMMTLGLGILAWYYASVISRHPARAGNAAASTGVQGDAPLPPLPPLAVPAAPATPRGASAGLRLAALPIETADAEHAAGAASTPAYGGPPAPAMPTRQERQLSGAAFARSAQASAGAAMAAGTATAATWPPLLAAGGTGTETALDALLKPPAVASTQAQLLPTRRFLLGKGSFIDCTLETAIDSTLPGMTTCITATDTFSVDGQVVLLERGTKLIGETRGQIQQGSARIFVLWTEARTPGGVVVPLASPGTDELGRSGLPGAVDRHFLDRFGAAMLISVVNGAVQAAAQSARSAGGAVIYNPTNSMDVLTEVLRSTVNIPPTVTKQHGDRIQVLVARDIDFRSVYELRPVQDGG